MREREELPPLPEPPPEDDLPPWDEPVRPAPVQKKAAPVRETVPAAEAEAVKTAPFPAAAPAPMQTPAASAPDDSPEAVFGLFLRRLRKLPKSGVAYALCRDLAPSREGDVLVLTTDVRTVCDTLNSERHRSVMQEVFAELGVSKFEVRFLSAQRAEEKDGVEQLKKDFSDYPVEVK